ncbi:dihydrolipoamide acetyltransferase family protein [Actinomadura madurae]|uniref:dihydrolipoamide acetyltransferase family protein n=1 Tax=Actinomadura madurae TaxID=1993 RepID=UPI0020D23A0E|nr:dihydrolipoamide acetyltransferase family protein [Actinomadura madurae]MCP9952559.1 2-oxo acid dehydrogenase subunit E2 [Actinomadura madurae]MCP9981790.1 2-oxo acid dehydrogenase subunit E2 [Actinomadura madurae]MCQ0006692.1 2-oxo acid dehydrogenase subunit E2 [Actinomadura madurae]MCQ0018003.1 2-oxo acid dehydrogenase subunit E2 [Actinomadura madurae]
MSEATVFRLPDLGEGLTEAEILEWKVKVGDTVAVDQSIVEVETAKAAVDVPVPLAGTVAELYAEAGTVVEVGAPLIAITAGDAAAARYREEERAGSGNVLVGYGTREPRRSRRRAARPDAGRTAVPARGEAPRVISPVVRRLALDNGIDVGALTPSGPGGVVLRRDVETAITARPGEPKDGDGVVRVPLKGARRTAAERLSRSRREIPDATTWVDVDATRLVKLRKDIQRSGARVGMLALFARICLAGLKRHPELNAYVDVERQEIVRVPEVHLGFAAQTDRGLVVPVVRDAHAMTLAELAAALRERTDDAREGRLAPSDLTGGTFTLNNYGVFGVDGSTPIINHPEAAMLGVGRIVEKPWGHKGKVRLRKVTQLSFTFDHRVCDGGVAGGFLRFVADCVERPEVLVTNL